VLQIRIRDPVPFLPRDPVPFLPRDPVPFLLWDPGWVKNQDPDPTSGSGVNILDHISGSLETIFWVTLIKFFNADADPGSKIFLTLDSD
jgi:hypothetical protein